MLSALPRFAVKGDEFKARVLVQNLGEKPAAIEVTAHDPEGLKLTGEKRAAFELSPGESRGASFAVKAVSTGRASIGFTARTLDHADAARFALEVIPATALETFAAGRGCSGRGKNRLNSTWPRPERPIPRAAGWR